MGHGIAQVVRGVRATPSRSRMPDDAGPVHERVRAQSRSPRRWTSAGRRDRGRARATLEDGARRRRRRLRSGARELELKQDIFARLDEITRPERDPRQQHLGRCRIARSRPRRTAGARRRHALVEPAAPVPLVEVIQAERTAGETIERTIDAAQRSRQDPRSTSKRDVPGFIGNRLQHALWREATRRSSTKGSATPRRSTPSSRRASGLGSPSSGRSRTPTSSAST